MMGSRRRISLSLDAAVSHHRRACALRTEAGKSLRVAATEEGRDGQHLCPRHNTLATATMNSYLKHPLPFVNCPRFEPGGALPCAQAAMVPARQCGGLDVHQQTQARPPPWFKRWGRFGCKPSQQG
jgi:hypothetical protein